MGAEEGRNASGFINFGLFIVMHPGHVVYFRHFISHGFLKMMRKMFALLSVSSTSKIVQSF